MSSLNPKLRHIQRQQVPILFGLPIKIFALASLCAGFLLLVSIHYLGWLFGLPIGSVFCVVIFSPMRWLHKEDKQAFEVWLDARRLAFTKERVVKKRVFLITHNLVKPYKTWRIEKHANKNAQ